MRIGIFSQRIFEHRLKHNGRTAVNILPVFFTCLLVALSLQLILPTSQPTTSYLHGPGISTAAISSNCTMEIVSLQPYFQTRDFIYQQQLLQHGRQRSPQAAPWIIHPHPGPDSEPPILTSDMPSGLKVTQWNLCSIAPRDGNTKLDQLKIILYDTDKKTHILGITETWLDANFNANSMNIKGYPTERVDRENRNLPFVKDGAGGVMIYILDSLNYIRREDLESMNMETIWIELTPRNHPRHLICVAYRSPDYTTNTLIDLFSEQLTNAYIECEQITILGDFNIDLLKYDNHSKTWLEIMEYYQFTQLINEPTRVTEKSKTLVDHILTPIPEKMRCTKVAKIGISDHFHTIAVFKDSFGNKQTHTSIKYRCYKNFDDDKFLNDLENALWVEIETIENVDEALEYWYKLFLKITNKHVPMKEKRVKRNKQPEWFNMSF